MSDNNSSNTHPVPWHKAMWRQHTTWFVIFAMIVCGVAWVVMSSANASLRDCHQKILAAYEHRTHSTDSLIASYRSLVADSSITPLTAIVLNQALSQASESLGQQEADQKTLHLLELEFAKIQNEYEVLNLWCALLTIVFLIFSFFSIFKTNEMTRQGEEALTKLGQTATEAKLKSDSIDTKVKEAEARVTKKTTELSDNATKKFGELDAKVSETTGRLNAVNTSLSENSSRLTELNTQLSEKQKELEEIIKQKTVTIDTYIQTHFEEEKRKFFTGIEEKVNGLSQEFRMLQDKINATPAVRAGSSLPDASSSGERDEDEEDDDNSEQE
ncbi:hypothetical protein [Muribaculum sp.]|uniref:hypothetical protein n=1 Tax=Muribaculum sp. TaxID=1918611 RepID=UPI0023D6B1DD|nr:hypothetical protein [Muribaculum sp.]MDE5705914.1 hypothetical protein [Muribaculum sp.]